MQYELETIESLKERIREGDWWLETKTEEWMRENLGMTRKELCEMLDLMEARQIEMEAKRGTP